MTMPAVFLYCCTLGLGTKEFMCDSSFLHHILTVMKFINEETGISMNIMKLRFTLLNKLTFNKIVYLIWTVGYIIKLHQKIYLNLNLLVYR